MRAHWAVIAFSKDISCHCLVVSLTEPFTLNVISIKQSAHFTVMTIGLLGNPCACTLSSKLNMELGISPEKPQGWITAELQSNRSVYSLCYVNGQGTALGSTTQIYHQPSLNSPVFQGHLHNGSLGDCSESSHDWLEKWLRVTGCPHESS